MSYRGDIRLGDTIDLKFTTRRFSTGAPYTLAGTPAVSAYVDNGTTEITAGITLTVDFDSRTGLNNVRVVATSGNGYAAGTNVDLVITAGTVDSVSVAGETIGSFSIEKRSALMPTTAGRTLVVDAAGLADANAVKLGPSGSGTAQTARDIGASVLLSSGTGTGQVKLSSGYVAPNWGDVGNPTTVVALSGTTIKTATDVEADTADIQTRLPAALGANGSIKADLRDVNGTTIAGTSTRVADRFLAFFNVATTGFTAATDLATTATYVVNSLPNVVPGTEGGLGLCNANLAVPADIAAIDTNGASAAYLDALAAAYNGGALAASVTSVVGNVGGNVTGSVGSVATGGITVASLASDCITAAKIADGAIDATTFAAGAITASALASDAITAAKIAADAGAEIAAAVWDLATSGHTTSGTFGAAAVAAGGSGDPWSTSLPGAYGAGTAGYLVGTYLDAAVSTRGTSTLTQTQVTGGTYSMQSASCVLGDARLANLDATVSSRASQTSVTTIDDFLDTEIAAIQTRVTTALPNAAPNAAGGLPTTTALWQSAMRSPSVVHVAKTGNDTTGDGSYAAPWLTLGHAASILAGTTGTAVVVWPGTYSEAGIESPAYVEWHFMRGSVFAATSGHCIWCDTDAVSIRGDGTLQPPANSPAVLVTDGLSDVTGVSIYLTTSGSTVAQTNASGGLAFRNVAVVAAGSGPSSPAAFFGGERPTDVSLFDVAFKYGVSSTRLTVGGGYPTAWDATSGQNYVGGVNAGGITASSLAADCITAAKVAADVGAEIAAAVWTTTTAGNFTAVGSPGKVLVGQLGGAFTTTTSSVYTVAALANAPAGGGGGGSAASVWAYTIDGQTAASWLAWAGLGASAGNVVRADNGDGTEAWTISDPDGGTAQIDATVRGSGSIRRSITGRSAPT